MSDSGQKSKCWHKKWMAERWFGHRPIVASAIFLPFIFLPITSFALFPQRGSPIHLCGPLQFSASSTFPSGMLPPRTE